MTDHVIPAPALRGDDALGFLASVGVMALSFTGAIPALRLRWSPGLAPHAEFVSTELTDTEDLGRVLRGAGVALASHGGVLPGAPADLPPPRKGVGKDPSRLMPLEAAKLFESAGASWRSGDPWYGRWAAALFGQTVADGEGRVKPAPIYAPFGQMSLRGSLLEASYETMLKVGGPEDALTGWIRTSFDGANLDARAKRNAAVVTDGKPSNQGAPSATWLAVMSPILMPLVERAGRSGAVGWQPVRLRWDLTSRSIVWPIWNGTLDPWAIQALLGHRALEVTGRNEEARLTRHRQLRGLGIRAVYGSSRSTQTQGDGPMARANRIWPSNP